MMLQLVLLFTSIHAGLASRTCNHDLKAIDLWKTVKSPGYPDPFPTQTQCSWRISAEPGYRIKLQFSGFNLSPSNMEGNCARQWLNIQFKDKVPDSPTQYYTLCGQDSPGTIVSPGSVLLLNLHSGSDAGGSQYRGFQASYAITDEPAMLPGDVKRLEPKKKPAAPNRQTLGSFLDKIRPQGSRPPNRRKPLTQNERIELLNRQRNQGKDVDHNPVFDTEGNLVGNIGQKPRKTTIKPASPYIPPSPPPKRAKPMSNEVKAVVIVICIIVVAFLILLAAKKLKLIQKIRSIREQRKKEEMHAMESGGGGKKIRRKRKLGRDEVAPPGKKEEGKRSKKRKRDKSVAKQNGKKAKKTEKQEVTSNGNKSRDKKRKEKSRDLTTDPKHKQDKPKKDNKNSSTVERKDKKRRKSFEDNNSSVDNHRKTRTSHAYVNEAYRPHKRRQRSPRRDTANRQRASRARRRRASSSSSSPGYFTDSSFDVFQPRRR